MGEPKFTKGPWTVGKRKDKNRGSAKAYIDGFSWDGLASVWVRLQNKDMDSDEGVANAHLIAAAPDLYAALAEIMHMRSTAAGVTREAADRARAALAKARGEA